MQERARERFKRLGTYEIIPGSRIIRISAAEQEKNPFENRKSYGE